MVARGQLGAAQHGAHLHIEVGIGLRRRPDREEQMRRRRPAPCGRARSSRRSPRPCAAPSRAARRASARPAPARRAATRSRTRATRRGAGRHRHLGADVGVRAPRAGRPRAPGRPSAPASRAACAPAPRGRAPACCRSSSAGWPSAARRHRRCGHRRAVEAGAREHLLRRAENQLAVGGANLALRACWRDPASRRPAFTSSWPPPTPRGCSAAAPGSFLITGELPPASSTFTVRS